MGDSFSVVLPYYNEANYLPRTLNCWLDQRRKPEQLILVDNGSTDGSAAICRRMLHNCATMEVIHLTEPRPGKIFALQTGCSRVESTFTVLADADTYYPPHYLSLCAAIAAEVSEEVVSIMAVPVHGDPDSLCSRLKRRAGVLLSRLINKGLVGGHGQILRMATLKEAGGFSIEYWNYVLLDHEILNRMYRYGRPLYNFDLWCRPSLRRQDRRKVRWNLFERLLYFLTPFSLQDWYFYRFLGPRLARREMSQLNLREKPWLDPPQRLEQTLELPLSTTPSVGVDSR